MASRLLPAAFTLASTPAQTIQSLETLSLSPFVLILITPPPAGKILRYIHLSISER